jgi:hypothetical protein
VRWVKSVRPHNLFSARDGDQEILRVDIQHSENAENRRFA